MLSNHSNLRRKCKTYVSEKRLVCALPKWLLLSFQSSSQDDVPLGDALLAWLRAAAYSLICRLISSCISWKLVNPSICQLATLWDNEVDEVLSLNASQSSAPESFTSLKGFTLSLFVGGGGLRGLSAAPLSLYVRPKILLSLSAACTSLALSLIHIWRCRRDPQCRSRWSPDH